MSIKDDLKAARKAAEKLNRYSGGLPKNSTATEKYNELNAEADAAIRKLPPALRPRTAIELLGKLSGLLS